jgi:hypothetical protein
MLNLGADARIWVKNDIESSGQRRRFIIKWDLKEWGWDNLTVVHLSEDSVQLSAVLNMVLNFYDSLKFWKFRDWTTANISWSTLLLTSSLAKKRSIEAGGKKFTFLCILPLVETQSEEDKYFQYIRFLFIALFSSLFLLYLFFQSSRNQTELRESVLISSAVIIPLKWSRDRVCRP